jgi:actin-related protein
MSGGVYGGDEVGALVFDFGSHSIRAGYAGEDTPKADIPSYVGSVVGTSPDSMETDTSTPSKKYYTGTTALHVPREGMELSHPLNDGLIEDWDLFEKIMDYFYEKNFRTDPEYHPVLFTEPPWNAKANREKLTEIMFEKYKVPAYFLCKTAVLSAFANGRASALVIDSGASQTSCTPVYDGYALTQAMLRTPLAGDFVTAQVRSYFEESGVEIVPSFYIATKDAVKEGATPVWSQKKNIPELSKSFHNYMVKLLLQDFTASICQVSETILADEIKNSSSIPLASYEFPNGYNLGLTVDKFKFCEGLYDASTQNLKVELGCHIFLCYAIHIVTVVT